MKPTELLTQLTDNLPQANRHASAYQLQEVEELLHTTAALCTHLRLAYIRDIVESGETSEEYAIAQKTRTERRVNAALLRDECPAVYAKCTYLETADAKRLLGGARGLYELAVAAAPERVAELERVSLRELDSRMSPAEQRRYVTAEVTAVGDPYVVRRDDV